MNKDIDERLRRLAEIVRRDKPSLNRYTPYLRNEKGKHGGPSMLGLICEAYTLMTNNGMWRRSHEPTIPNYAAGGEVQDKVLPTEVVEYFGLRDKEGTFDIGELPRKVKDLMTNDRNSGHSSLLNVGRNYGERGKEIVAQILESAPSSLRKQEPNWLTDNISQKKPLKIDLTGIE